MKNNKMVYVAVGVVVFSVILLMVTLFMSVGGSKGVKVDKDTTTLLTSYISPINTGEYSKAYVNLDTTTKGYLTEEGFTTLINIIMDEKDSRLEVGDLSKVSNQQLIQGESKVDYILVPAKRVYVKTIDDISTTVEDEFNIMIINEKTGPKVYIPQVVYYEYLYKYVIGKAKEYATESLENKNSSKIVDENSLKIYEYLSVARQIPETESYYAEAAVQIELITVYDLLARGDYEKAMSVISAAYEKATTIEQKVKISSVESEIYFSEGRYDKAVEVLKGALELAPKDESIRTDYRRINKMMLEQIQTLLNEGWDQVNSAIKQEEVERKRILSDIAMGKAENAIKVKEDAPDGYYLKGNIEYCLGDYNNAILSLEQAIELSKVEDTEFRTKAAEILGMAKIAQVSDAEEIKIDSYISIFDKDLRSLLFRENEVSGIVDSIN